MGCSQSKIENEEAVSRCKERKQFMKEAVSARNAFAAAHSAYAISLKNTGAALSDYAQGEVGHHHPHSPPSSTAAAATSSSVDTLPPPPPLPNFQNTPPLVRAASMPEMKIPKPESKPVEPTIMEDEELEFEAQDSEKLIRKRSSNTNSSRGEASSQPPRPPPHQQPQQQQWKQEEVVMRAPPMNQGSSWGDYIFAHVDSMPGPSLAEPAMDDEEEEVVERVSRVRLMEVGPTPPLVVVEEEGRVERAVEVPVPMPIEKKGVKKGGGEVGRRLAKPVSLMQIFSELDDHFLKASESAHEVSKMLEATRLHYHSNFADNRG